MKALVAVVILLAGVACASAVRDTSPGPWQNDEPPGMPGPRALKPTSLLLARTSHCVARKGRDGFYRPNRIAFGGSSCLCDLSYCGGTPWSPEDGTWEGEPLRGTGLGQGRYVCESMGGSLAADENGCPLRQPQAGEPCLERWGRLGIECLYLHGDSAVRLACRGTAWVALDGRCNRNVP